MSFFSFLTQELAIDLGTANTLIIHKDKVVVDEPSIIAIERNTGNVIAIGKDAMQMFGKENEGIKTIRPLKDGVIADFQAAEHMIRGMINHASNHVLSSLKISNNPILKRSNRLDTFVLFPKHLHCIFSYGNYIARISFYCDDTRFINNHFILVNN